jgi:ABC-type transport system involved in multi-copper enzyme maturation permease subunit
VVTELSPVLVKELRQRFRFWHSGTILALYLLVIGVFVLGFIYVSQQEAGMVFRPGVSASIFGLLSVTQLVLLGFVIPGLTAGTVSGEREKQTLNVLLATNLSPLNIIANKMAAACAFTVLLVVATLPLYAMVFLYGGIAPGQVLGVFGFYLVTMFLFAAVGMACSTWFGRTVAATVTAYGITFALGAGTGFLAAFIYQINQMSGNWSSQEPVSFAVQFLQNINPVFVLMRILDGEGSVMGVERTMFLPYWGVYVVFFLAVGAGLLLWSSRRLNPLKADEVR